MANLSYTQCNDLLKTLPIGFYLGHGLVVMLDPVGEQTFVNRLTEEITISYPMIAEALEAYPDDMTPEELESVVRGLLYHEISHLLLTPQIDDDRWSNVKWLCNHAGLDLKVFPRIFNIIEDERIETILRNHFLNVDFERNKKLILRDTDMTNPDPVSRFFRAVRLHVGPHDTLVAIAQFICDNAKITATTDWGGYGGARDYCEAVINLFMTYFAPPATSGESETPEKKSTSDGTPGNIPTQKDGEKSDDDDTPEMPHAEGAPAKGTTAEGNPEDSSETPDDAPFEEIEDEIKKQIAEMLGVDEKTALEKLAEALVQDILECAFVNEEIAEQRPRVKRIITQALNRRNNHSSSSSAYAGHFDPRLTMNKDYRWWVKPNNGSAGNKFSKLKINLFVDTSGSFMRSENAINALIKVLCELENRDFELDVVSMNTENRLRPKKSRWVKIRGGNDLTEGDLPGIYRQIQTPNARVFNIAVFDGWAFTDTDYDKRTKKNFQKAFSVFNHPNCIVVSDTDNEEVIEKACPEARKKIISSGYASTFIDEVLNLLDRMIA